MAEMRTAAVIPCYRAYGTATAVARECTKYVDAVVCVDDCCPEDTGTHIERELGRSGVVVLRNLKNKGVGGATKVGIRYAIENGADIVIKIDADGQMRPQQIPELIREIRLGNADICKGNRFWSVEVIDKMPLVRLMGNVGLSFLTKISTGYWELFDPTNGFLAISAKALTQISLDKLDDRYFFETDLLFRAGLADLVINEIRIPTLYDNYKSSLSPARELVSFSKKHMVMLPKRIIYQYFLLDFNPGSFSLLLGVLFLFVACLIGASRVYEGLSTGEYAKGGTLTVFLSFLIIGFQLLIAFVYYDVTQRVLLRALRRRTRGGGDKC